MFNLDVIAFFVFADERPEAPGRPVIASRVDTSVQILKHQPRNLSSRRGSKVQNEVGNERLKDSKGPIGKPYALP